MAKSKFTTFVGKVRAYDSDTRVVTFVGGVQIVLRRGSRTSPKKGDQYSYRDASGRVGSLGEVPVSATLVDQIWETPSTKPSKARRGVNTRDRS